MKRLAIIVIAQSVLLVALVISLCWNIQQARESSARGQRLYVIGLRDGALYTLGELERRLAEMELIDDQRAEAAKERL